MTTAVSNPSEPSGHLRSMVERFIGGNGLTMAIVSVTVMSVALPLQQAQWVRGMIPLTVVALLGGALAYALHRSGWSPLRRHVWAGSLGLVLTFTAGVVLTDGFATFVRILDLVGELVGWFRAIPTQEVRSGLVEFAMFLVLMIWTFSYLSVWLALRRATGWITVLLGGIVLSFALGHIADSATLWLGLFLAASVLLLIHMNIVRRMVGWRARRTSFDPQTVLGQSAIVLAFGLVIAILVTAAPIPKIAPLSGISHQMERGMDAASAQFSRLFNGLPSRRSYRTIVYEPKTVFRGNPNLTDHLLFTVTGGTPTYWRVAAYTSYLSSGWQAPESDYRPYEDIPNNHDRSRASSTHQFRVSAATDTLFSGGLPGGFDEPAEASVDGLDLSDVLHTRFSQGREFFPTRVNLSYMSTGLESLATAADLRQAGTDYPEGLIDVYTQLPATLPQRVRDLAPGIVGGAENNNYDKAIAIRDFVSSYPYNLDIPAPPLGVDGVDYFLFDSQQGYCDYYASSTAVLLRAIGVPSRYVLGYAAGNYNEGRAAWDVLELHYHSWVEAYFPGYGWIPFEPTPPDAIEFGGNSGIGPTPIEADTFDFDGLGPFPEDEEEEGLPALSASGGGGPGFWLTGSLLLIGLAASGAAFVLWYEWWWRLGRLRRADELYAKMVRLGSLLGLPQRPDQTSVEYAASLAEEMPRQAREIGEITRAYLVRRYSARMVSLDGIRAAERSWSSLRWALIRRLFRVRPA